MRYVRAAGIGIAILGGVLWAAGRTDAPAQQTGSGSDAPHEQAMVQVNLPSELSEQARIGQAGFDAKCAACHGLSAAGQQGTAPPLVHKIYEPSHHGDESFQRAVAQGVRAHHWRFGDMPPVAGLTRADVGAIIAYIRELQRANGIH